MSWNELDDKEKRMLLTSLTLDIIIVGIAVGMLILAGIAIWGEH